MRASIQGKGAGHGRCADLKKQIEAKKSRRREALSGAPSEKRLRRRVFLLCAGMYAVVSVTQPCFPLPLKGLPLSTDSDSMVLVGFRETEW